MKNLKIKIKKTIWYTILNFIKWKIWGGYKAGGICGIYHYIRCHLWDRYHIVNISGEAGYLWGWEETDNKILLVNFKLLKEFVEQQDPTIGLRTLDDYFPKNYDFFEGELESVQLQIKREQEVRMLYNWWTIERPKEQDYCEELLTKYTGRDWYEKRQELDKIDEEMLVRLVKIRQCLWT